MSDSPLAKVKILSPNHSGQRNHEIDTITIHCYVGQITAERGCNGFAKPSRKASCNYVIGYDGKIGLCVEEKNRSWCSGGKDKNGNPIRVNGISGEDNDHRAITIEVASDTTEPYAVTDEAYAALIDLVTDICKRNGIEELRWKADKSLVGQVDKQNMTVHRWFANKSCPGTYLFDRHSRIAAEVNARLGGSSNEQGSSAPLTAFKAGDVVKINGTQYYGGKSVPSWVKAKNWVVHSASGSRVVVNKSADGANAIMSPFKASDLALVRSNKVEDKPVAKKVAYAQSKDSSLAGTYKVTATDGLNMRYKPGVLTKDNVILAIPYGASVRNYGYFTKVDGTKWLYIAYKDKVGFIHSGYVKKS